MIGTTQDFRDSAVAARCRSGEYVPQVSGHVRHAQPVAGPVPRRGEAGTKSREVEVEDEEKRRLKSLVASLSVETELLREKSR